MMDAEQVLAQAVAPHVETVGDAVDAAVAGLAALRSAGFQVVPRLTASEEGQRGTSRLVRRGVGMSGIWVGSWWCVECRKEHAESSTKGGRDER